MPCESAPQPAAENPGSGPWSKLGRFLIEEYYRQAGCNDWTSRRVRELCVKLGDTPDRMAARLRVNPAEFKRRIEQDSWTKQDGLILTMLERDADVMMGGKFPEKPLFAPA